MSKSRPDNFNLENPFEPKPGSPEMLSLQVVEAMRGMEMILRMSINEPAARSEARWHLSRLSESLINLSESALYNKNAALQPAWEALQSELRVFTTFTPEEKAPETVANLTQEEVARRLNISIPSHLRVGSMPKSDGDAVKRKVLIASLEKDDNTARMVNQAAVTFPAETWQVVNLGAHVPILALTGMVKDMRPSVLVLVVNKGQYMPETIRLIEDLKKQLFGMRVVAVGPALNHLNLADRLRTDLHSSDITKTAELAEQFFNSLNKLGDRLRLAVELPDEVTTTPPDAPAQPETAPVETLPEVIPSPPNLYTAELTLTRPDVAPVAEVTPVAEETTPAEAASETPKPAKEATNGEEKSPEKPNSNLRNRLRQINSRMRRK
jgi:hypothetical protein